MHSPRRDSAPKSAVADAYEELAAGLRELAQRLEARPADDAKPRTGSRATSSAPPVPAAAARPARSVLAQASLALGCSAELATVCAVAFQVAYELFPPARPSLGI